MNDYILREEEDRFHLYFYRKADHQQQNLGCFSSEDEAREVWVEAQRVVNKVRALPGNIDLWQSRTCSGEPPFLLKMGM